MEVQTKEQQIHESLFQEPCYEYEVALRMDIGSFLPPHIYAHSFIHS